MIELGWLDICLEVSEMLSFMATPTEGHLEQLLYIFTHLKKYHNNELVFDPSEPSVDMSIFQRRIWASSKFRHL